MLVILVIIAAIILPASGITGMILRYSHSKLNIYLPPARYALRLKALEAEKEEKIQSALTEDEIDSVLEQYSTLVKHTKLAKRRR